MLISVCRNTAIYVIRMKLYLMFEIYVKEKCFREPHKQYKECQTVFFFNKSDTGIWIFSVK